MGNASKTPAKQDSAKAKPVQTVTTVWKASAFPTHATTPPAHLDRLASTNDASTIRVTTSNVPTDKSARTASARITQEATTTGKATPTAKVPPTPKATPTVKSQPTTMALNPTRMVLKDLTS